MWAIPDPLAVDDSSDGGDISDEEDEDLNMAQRDFVFGPKKCSRKTGTRTKDVLGIDDEEER